MTLRLVNAVTVNQPTPARTVRRTNFSPLNVQAQQTPEQLAECARVEARLQDIHAALFKPNRVADRAEAA